MSVILTKQQDTAVPIALMKDGELAIITYAENSGYQGNIVMRHHNDLICIGEKYGESWTGLFDHSVSFEVKILHQGDQLTIT